jgi:hypothetical protein
MTVGVQSLEIIQETPQQKGAVSRFAWVPGAYRRRDTVKKRTIHRLDRSAN